MAKPVLRTLRELRVERGLTLPDLQLVTGINKGTLSQIERGRIVASPREARLLSQALGYRLETRTVLVYEDPPEERQ